MIWGSLPATAVILASGACWVGSARAGVTSLCVGTGRIVFRSPVGFRIPIAGFRLLGISQDRVRTRKNLILPCFLRHIRNVLKSLFFFLVQKRPNEISTIMMCCKKQGKITFFGDEKNWWRAPLSALPGFFQVGAGGSPNLHFFSPKTRCREHPPEPQNRVAPWNWPCIWDSTFRDCQKVERPTSGTILASFLL